LVHLTALVETPEHVCCRYRLAAFRPWLAQAGHTLELLCWPRTWWGWARLGSRLRSADVVILQRRLLNPWQRYLVRRAARCLVFDFDDAVFLRDSYAAKGLHSARRVRRFHALVRNADAVVAGNPFLARQTARAGRLPRLRVIPTCVDPRRYPVAQHRRTDNRVELVWVGSSSTLRGLYSLCPVLEGVGRAWRPSGGLRLKLICDRFFTLRHVDVMPCPWTEEGEAREIAAADIGISWLPDDLWSRGKCGLKVLQYMAAGLPVVANSVGIQADLVRHGETGYLADTPEQWADALVRLGSDAGLRWRLGQAGRRRVEEAFGVAVGAAAWTELLHEVRPRQRVA
jgi:glycosyltransferase involved in cell wall biosynthesis